MRRYLRLAQLVGLALIAALAPAQVCRVGGRLVYCTGGCCVSCVLVTCSNGASDCAFCFTACSDGSGTQGGC